MTFLVTDIEDSTRLWESNPTEMAEAVRMHDIIVRSAIERQGGHVFAAGGDGFSAVFPSAVDAVTAAIESQRALVSEDVIPFAVQIALHTGEAEERDRSSRSSGEPGRRTSWRPGAKTSGTPAWGPPSTPPLFGERPGSVVDQEGRSRNRPGLLTMYPATDGDRIRRSCRSWCRGSSRRGVPLEASRLEFLWCHRNPVVYGGVKGEHKWLRDVRSLASAV